MDRFFQTTKSNVNESPLIRGQGGFTYETINKSVTRKVFLAGKLFRSRDVVVNMVRIGLSS